jgi:hypothetical protein
MIDLKFDRVSKKYRIYHQPEEEKSPTALRRLTRRWRGNYTDFWEVEFIVREPIEDALIEVYFYSIFHNLHSHFSTDSEQVKLDLERGLGTVEFFCPELPFEPASFFVEASIRHRQSDFTEHLDYMHATSIHVTKGKPLNGVFHTFHTWSLKTAVQQEAEVTERVKKF